MIELDALEEVLDPLSQLADLDRAGRIALDQLLGEHAGADRIGVNLADSVGNRPDRNLGRTASHIDDRDLAGHRMAERLRGPEEGETPLLVVGEDFNGDSAALGDLADDRLAVGRLPDGGGRDDPDLLGAELLRQPDLGYDDVDDLLEL